jgi:hypothetical protein
MDADSQARLGMDRLALDFAAMPLRADLDYVFDKKIGDDAPSFHAPVKGYQDGLPDTGSPQEVSVLGYRMSPEANLERSARALPWDGVVFAPGERAGDVEPVSLVSSPLNTLSTLDSDTAPSNYEVLVDQALRFELGFLPKAIPALRPRAPRPHLQPRFRPMQRSETLRH